MKKHLDANNPKLHIPLLKKILYSDNFYIEGDYQIGHIMGINLLSGFYFHNCNFEIGVLKPIDDSEIMWPYYEDPFTLKSTFSINTGYGLLFGNRLRISPRVGMTYYRIVKDQDKDDLEMESYVISGSTGIRLEYSPI